MKKPSTPHKGPRQKPPKPTSYAGPTTCLRCDALFNSWDRRQNRLCPQCQNAIKAHPSGEPVYFIATSKHRLHRADDV
jgi:hypothetical protein